MEEVKLLPHTIEEIFSLDINDKQVKGWEIEKLGVDRQWVKSRGEGVIVGVIDSGCDKDHPDIKENIIGGYNFINNSHNFFDDNSHGSHVCGTIASTDNGKGMVGVAPKASIYALKTIGSDGRGKTSDVAMAIEYGVKNNFDILTMSIGIPFNIKEIKEALILAREKNILVFCAAGNSGEETDIMYPARDVNAISIGAIDENFNRTNFTCSGESLDFLAPGHNIMSILPAQRYGLMSGTSMSNPFAVGCAALYLSYYRQKKNQKHISQEEMIDLFKKHTLNVKNPAYRQKKYQGYGIIKPILE
jgi:major intracellular serine protease